MVETLAPKLQALLGELFQIYAPVVPAAIAGPCLVTTSVSSGDSKSGYTTYERIELLGITSLRLEFRYAFHEISSQCYEWTLFVSGAPEATHLPIVDVFHPSQQTLPWNPTVRPEIHFY